ncbi:MAG: signal peptidase II [Bacteroidetes bacterium]|nr:signal peptidase II [Bacteroidota bacterium]
MTSKKITRLLIIFSIIVINIGCDQVTKSIVRKEVVPYSTIHMLSNHLTLTKVENAGAFLSAGDHLSGQLRFIILTLLPVIAMIAGIIYIFTKQNLHLITTMGICFVIGGGIGNIFDRIIYGSVTDFLHISVAGMQTGIFNMADVSIMTGAALIFLSSLLKSNKSSTIKAA